MTSNTDSITGRLSVLNTGAGDIQISFNKENPDEAARALAMLRDMQQRGYAIMVRMPDGTYTRAVSIDADRGEYIVMPASESDASGSGLDDGPEPSASASLATEPKEKSGRGRRGNTGRVARRVAVTDVQAVAVARSAGGCDRLWLRRLADARGRA